MGQRIIALASSDARFRLAAALDRAESGCVGQDAGESAGVGNCGIAISARCESCFDVLIDFSSATATQGWLELCATRGRPIVIGTTGHTVEQTAAIEAAAKRIAVLKSANMSVGVNALLRIVEQLAGALGAEYDVEIGETHHRFKVDAPSGTALALKDAVLRGRSRQGPSKQIDIRSVRTGDVVGEHEVRFSTADESVIVRHVAHSRDTFARGALAAAGWIIGRPPGMYAMTDVLAGNSGRGHAGGGGV